MTGSEEEGEKWGTFAALALGVSSTRDSPHHPHTVLTILSSCRGRPNCTQGSNPPARLVWCAGHLCSRPFPPTKTKSSARRHLRAGAVLTVRNSQSRITRSCWECGTNVCCLH